MLPHPSSVNTLCWDPQVVSTLKQSYLKKKNFSPFYNLTYSKISYAIFRGNIWLLEVLETPLSTFGVSKVVKLLCWKNSVGADTLFWAGVRPDITYWRVRQDPSSSMLVLNQLRYTAIFRNHSFLFFGKLVIRIWETRNWSAEIWDVMEGHVQSASWSPCGTKALFSDSKQPTLYCVSVERLPPLGEKMTHSLQVFYKVSHFQLTIFDFLIFLIHFF